MTVTGWLVVNAFLRSAKFDELYADILTNAAKMNIAMQVVTNTEVLGALRTGKPDFALVWDKDIRCAQLLEHVGIRCFNRADAIAICDDKTATYLGLLDVLPQPATVIVPMRFGQVKWHDQRFVDDAIAALGLPLVAKEAFGSFGSQVFLIHTRDELLQFLDRIENRPALLQEFIANSRGRDVRMQVVGNTVVSSMLRESGNGDFRANLTNGGVGTVVTLPEAFATMAIQACQHLQLDFAGVDLLFGPDEQPIICEINSNAHFINLNKVADANIAADILAHILQCLQEQDQK
ncbi:RimK family alpha-L-glutamate ligase [Corynebacterium sp. HS2168-gen11]|uniref:ATP-grasp domain-containing protein n=1 Tax=Corynebacterium sp. HS2168-gen11 TaxID=2974027 RepID=UPI00216B23D2|nr:RimK family alpha-L-glutamate ligase [Corynebacterium sp. HS2168-gen11]MCS4535330.1 RimK family alpha-L-glutamate ligase [Corynebacterium sp. HS2168-gen11]